MKKLILTALTGLIALVGFSQVPRNPNPNSNQITAIGRTYYTNGQISQTDTVTNLSTTQLKYGVNVLTATTTHVDTIYVSLPVNPVNNASVIIVTMDSLESVQYVANHQDSMIVNPVTVIYPKSSAKYIFDGALSKYATW